MAETIMSMAGMVANPVINEVAFLLNAKNEVESLAEKLKDIRSKLETAYVMTDREEEFHEWVSQLRNLAFKAEDVIEVFINNPTPDDGHDFLQLVMWFFRQIIVLHKLKIKIDDINSKLESLNKLSETSSAHIQIRSPVDGETSTLHWRRDQASSRIDEDEIVGFQKETEELVSSLIKEEPRRRLVVLPIWAPGGAGKTALAQKIYKNSIVKSQFNCVAWVSVSPNFAVKDIWQAILEQAKELTGEEKMGLQTKKDDELRSMVHNYLEGKNYFIVVDDLWKKNDWEIITMAFPISPQMKCRVLLTTRIEEVARGADPLSAPVKLQVLNEEESMELFLKKVYRCSSDQIPNLSREMKNLAKQLVSKCEGLPIAIVLLGGALSGKDQAINEWRSMLDRVHSCLLIESRDFRKVVAMSYNELPYHLKSCFLYFGLFPEDSVIECDKLIRLWVAEGFLPRRSDNEVIEDVGRECLKDLIQRSMIQVVEWKSSGDPQTCRTHDLIRALAIQEAKKAKFSSISKEKHLGVSSVEGSRRIALHPKDIDQFHRMPTAPSLQSSEALTVSRPYRRSLSSTVPTDGQRPSVVVERDDDIVGFQEEEDKLASLLRKKKPQGRLAIISIVGNGGGGKTALARKVYNRNDVKSNFSCRAWVYVSQEYVLKDLLQSMLQQVTTLTDADLKHKEEEELQRILRYRLERKSYLIVLDDLWREEDWDVIERVFPKPFKGRKCRVLLTTRNLDVAKYADPSTDNWLMLPALNEMDSLKLFLETVFKCSEDEIPKASLSKEMKDIARKIVVEKCHGLPLIILLLGGLLSVKRTDVSVWADILKSLNRHGSLFTVLHVVDLCYVDLPDNLRSCVFYFRLFPPEDTIKCDTLIHLWAAGGFLEPTKDDEDVKDVAKRCLGELIQRNLIEVAKRRSDGAPVTCRIHVLLRDLALMEAKKAELSRSSENYNHLDNHHPILALHPKDSDQVLHGTSAAHHPHVFQPYEALIRLMNHLLSFRDPFKFQNHLHSLLCFSKNPQICYQGLHLLRVLDLEGAENIMEVPNEIRNLTLLRYLSLHGTRVKLIPPWIANLPNLQTLDAPRSKIPIDTLRLNQLRHLFADSFSSYPDSSSLSLCIGDLEHLHTLQLDIGDWVTSGGLDDLTNLRVLRLRLKGCNDIGSKQNALCEAVANLKRLESLRLTQAEASYSSPMDLPSLSTHRHLNEIVVEGTFTKLPRDDQFPPYLSYLWLENYIYGVDSVDPLFTLQKLPCLKKLCLRLSKAGKMTCSKGGFPKLEHLYIRVYFEPKNWTVKQGTLPSLRVLHIEGDHRLGKLPDGLRHVTTLKELIITRGYDVKDSLINEGEEWDKVKHIGPSIKYLDDSFMRP
ncbi:probable disease resistance RPP8-like protein 4 [Macadamia integrifolia]|uniref:probable disease resistance RPP8-like protein 4 n=1 Tax=Macadamia integrifolia TaxID=60698 RepID=UPI001C4F53E6|nr:probable disease resistance RPP8-like protein 4 [Macadamia integrifolia]XP_042503317.1 probable disease resistance RPP8-like protein 4 [Macadamia integrifolia]XP_042503318.1 probable disease resistance RPP8-like protein 4 [Macadamia integrifolia]XP_042503320.1 probable disease resistance RPP8-like protein 4 [Macadamia integrifolia]XP_042503321.1 probable disease resistance RPP8-like protein 4 [Macadamia integrifolia]